MILREYYLEKKLRKFYIKRVKFFRKFLKYSTPSVIGQRGRRGEEEGKIKEKKLVNK